MATVLCPNFYPASCCLALCEKTVCVCLSVLSVCVFALASQFLFSLEHQAKAGYNTKRVYVREGNLTPN